MTLIRDLSTSFGCIFSLVLFMILFESRYSRKRTLMLTAALMVPLLAANLILLFLLGPEKMSTLLLLTCSLPSLIFYWFLAKHRDGRFFFTFCLADTLILEILHLTCILDFFLGNTYLFMLAARLILCPLLAWSLFRWIRPVYLDVQNHVNKGWYPLTAIALIFYIALSISISYPSVVTSRLEYLPVHLLLLLLMPVIYIHIFSTLFHQKNTYEMAEKEHILQVQASSLRSRVEEFTVADSSFRMERHDFRHKMQTIAQLVEQQRYTELHRLVNEYRQSVGDIHVKRYCTYPVIDAVFSSYLQQAERKGIHVSTKLLFPGELPVSEAELATVFANAIENAIHACEKLEPGKRCLDIQVLSVPCFMFQVRNSFDGVAAFDKDGVPVAARKGHGFGTRSIVTFCEKNGAFFEFKADEGIFSLRISIG